MSPIFVEIGLVIIVAAALSLFVRLFRQPPLLGYILAGLILGPLGAKLISNPEVLTALRQVGVALLLFLVGMELDLNKARQQLHTISVVGILLTLISFGAGYAVALGLGYSPVNGLYVGLALAFASTVIVVKILSESRDLNSLPGRLSLGLLLFQDGIAIAALTLLTGFSHSSNLSPVIVFLILALKTGALLLLTWILAQYILPPLFAKLAHTGELLFLSALAWCFIFALLLSASGFSLEIGALLAGVSLASLPYSLDILNRLRSIRDFFVILLFVSLGSSVTSISLGVIPLILILTTITVVGKPIITFGLLTIQGYTSRSAFLASLTQGQLSEFSLLLTSLGLQYGQLSPSLAAALTLTAIISFFISTIVLTARLRLYNRLRPLLHNFERDHHHIRQLAGQEEEREDHIIIIGYHRMGYHILKKLRQLGHQVIIVDFNPDIVRKLKEQDIESIYGDVQDEELLEKLQTGKAKMVISTVPHREETMFLIEFLREHKSKAISIVTAHHIDDALDYYQLGASYVLLPHILGGEHVADLIVRYEHDQLGELIAHRAEEIKLLRTKNHQLYYD